MAYTRWSGCNGCGGIADLVRDGASLPFFFARGGLARRETVLIQAAAGGVGLAAVQLAAQSGATVIGVASGSQRSSRLIELGAIHVVDRTAHDVVDAVRQITHGAGTNLVVGPVGTALQDSIAALAPEGHLVFVGNAGGGNLAVVQSSHERTFGAVFLSQSRQIGIECGKAVLAPMQALHGGQ